MAAEGAKAGFSASGKRGGIFAKAVFGEADMREFALVCGVLESYFGLGLALSNPGRDAPREARGQDPWFEGRPVV